VKKFIRIARRYDISLLVNHRKLMFLEMNRLRGTPVNMTALERMCGQYSVFLKKHLGKDVFGFILEIDKTPVASGAASIMGIWPPSVTLPKEHSAGYVYGIYCEPSFRKKGLARTVMKSIIKQLKVRGASLVTLYASAAGVSLYESLGFIHKTSWMTLEIKKQKK
jgi:ribosomal protein S18 acetylase RimI-like enzyme